MYLSGQAKKAEEFEALMLEAKSLLEKQEGLPPLKINRSVKSVKYMLYWEFDTKESYGAAHKNLYTSYWKSIEKRLIVPHDKDLGESVF